MKLEEKFKKAVELINQSNSILITTHTRPDGDACGSVVAMCEVLAGLGKDTKLLFLSENGMSFSLLKKFRFLVKMFSFRIWRQDVSSNLI